MHHDLKIDPPYFEAVIDGRKTFEIRYNDRGYNAGDTVLLREHNGVTYTGRRHRAQIGYVTSFRQKDEFVVFSLLPDTTEPADGVDKL